MISLNYSIDIPGTTRVPPEAISMRRSIPQPNSTPTWEDPRDRRKGRIIGILGRRTEKRLQTSTRRASPMDFDTIATAIKSWRSYHTHFQNMTCRSPHPAGGKLDTTQHRTSEPPYLAASHPRIAGCQAKA